MKKKLKKLSLRKSRLIHKLVKSKDKIDKIDHQFEKIKEKKDMSRMKTITLHTHIGQLGDQATNWWTEKDWEQWRKEVRRMKKEGTFGKPIDITFSFKQMETFNANDGSDLFATGKMGLFIPIKKK